MLNTIQDRQSRTRRPSRAVRTTGSLVAALGLAALLSGCQRSDQTLFLGDMASGYNREVFFMSLWAIALSVIIFVGVSAALFYTVQKFREDKNPNAPQQFHGNNRLETLLVAVPVVIVILLSVLTVRSMARLNPVPAGTPKIDILGKQFWWNFAYPATTADAGGVVTNGNEMVMPAGRLVTLNVTSGDVVHGFWAPNIGGQRAAIPSVVRTWNVDTDRPGVYQGNCSQLCGASHANMRYKVIALSQERYDAFLAAAKAYRAPAPAAGSAEERGYNLFVNGKPETGALACAACHRVQGTPAAGAAGPDLSFFGTRRTLGAGMWEGDKARDMLEPWIKNSPEVKPGSLMPTYDGSEYTVSGKKQKGGVLTDDEIGDIAAYLRSLRLPDDADYWRDTPVIKNISAPGGQQ
ncbi:cytochrome c oxidase subunit II [Deinococcus enclensis]|uniref:Cytochrome c oxidase subunit 2 n=1 Tax=Deinococcus enclensis TaxID=1049582 RepID=A0ABT9M9M2_9DEIO|nr:cytochrome c oxidase subunit II [Deinococcus enclensis]MDP9763278.1 cytochrome c oxidase subunit 2 [Deinococcus enclensis]